MGVLTLRGQLRRAVAACSTALVSAALVVTSLVAAAPANAAAGGGHGKPLPYRIFAPYFETWDTTDGGLAALSQASGARFLSLAFLQTATPGSCTADWNGDPSQPIDGSTFGADIAAIQAQGGDVIPSFGGYTADTTGTEVADSCASVPAIASVYESLITTYHVSRIDMDIEGDSVTNAAAIDRRNKAIAMTEAWAAARHLPIQFSYTLPTFATGLPPAELSVLQNAVADGATISTVNLLTFDYYYGTLQDMLANTATAAAGTVSELQTLYPGVSARTLWHMIGVTEMPGIDDFGPDETFPAADAAPLLQWADQQGIGFLSYWALQRDNGGCPGTKGAGSCSGLDQPQWFFTQTWDPFTGDSHSANN